MHDLFANAIVKLQNPKLTADHLAYHLATDALMLTCEYQLYEKMLSEALDSEI